MNPNDVPDELVELTAAALCNNDNHGTTWDKVRRSTADRYRRLAARALDAVLPAHEATVRARVADEIEAEADRRGDGSLWDGGMDTAARIARGEAHA